MSRTFPNSNSSSQEISFEEKAYSSSTSLSDFVSDPVFSHLKEELTSSIIQLKTLDLALSSFMKLKQAERPGKSTDLFNEISISEKSVKSLRGPINKAEDAFQEIQISLRA